MALQKQRYKITLSLRSSFFDSLCIEPKAVDWKMPLTPPSLTNEDSLFNGSSHEFEANLEDMIRSRESLDPYYEMTDCCEDERDAFWQQSLGLTVSSISTPFSFLKHQSPRSSSPIPQTALSSQHFPKSTTPRSTAGIASDWPRFQVSSLVLGS